VCPSKAARAVALVGAESKGIRVLGSGNDLERFLSKAENLPGGPDLALKSPSSVARNRSGGAYWLSRSENEAAVGAYDLARLSIRTARATQLGHDLRPDLVPGSGLPPAHHGPLRDSGRGPVWLKLFPFR